jgi:hypothetical protein
MFAVGGTVACRAQATQDQSTQSQKVAHKNKKAKNASSYKRHWYSPVSWFHKKHSSEARNAKPAGKHLASSSHKRHWYSPVSWFRKNHSSEAKNRKPASQHVASTQAAATAPTSSKSSLLTGTSNSNTAAASKTAAAGKGTGKAGCTPEQAKKTGCTVDKNHTQKGTTSAAGANPS